MMLLSLLHLSALWYQQKTSGVSHRQWLFFRFAEVRQENHTDAWYCLNLIGGLGGFFCCIWHFYWYFLVREMGWGLNSNLFLSYKYFVIRKPFKIEECDVFSHVLSLASDWFCRWCKMACDPPVIKRFLSTKQGCCMETLQVHVPGYKTTQSTE